MSKVRCTATHGRRFLCPCSPLTGSSESFAEIRRSTVFAGYLSLSMAVGLQSDIGVEKEWDWLGKGKDVGKDVKKTYGYICTHLVLS